MKTFTSNKVRNTSKSFMVKNTVKFNDCEEAGR